MSWQYTGIVMVIFLLQLLNHETYSQKITAINTGCLSANLPNIDSIRCTEDVYKNANHFLQYEFPVGTICTQACGTGHDGLSVTEEYSCSTAGIWKMIQTACTSGSQTSRSTRNKRGWRRRISIRTRFIRMRVRRIWTGVRRIGTPVIPIGEDTLICGIKSVFGGDCSKPGDDSVCDPNPCNGHRCVPQATGFICDCSDGYRGATCDDPPGDAACIRNLCQNGATCHFETTFVYNCSCSDGFYGDFCQYEIVNGGWTDWSPWSQCSVSCNGGLQFRTRTCNQPKPGIFGKECEGNIKQDQSCNTEKCKGCGFLRKSYGNILSCDIDSSISNCSVSCRPGLEFESDPSPYYICGVQTGFVWSHQLNDADATLPKCLTSRGADRVQLNNTVEFPEAPCNPADEQKEEATTSLQSFLKTSLYRSECLKSGQCVMSATVQPCGTNRQKKNNGLTIILGITASVENADFLENGSLSEEEASSKEGSYADLLVEFAQLAIAIHESVQSGSLKVTMGGTEYIAARDSFRQTGLLVCPPGSLQHGLVCALCLPGHFSSMGQECEKCPQHSYQDQEGQAQCKSCPPDTGTNITGATNISMCEASPVSTVSHTYIITVCGLSGFSIIAMVIAAGIICHCKNKNRKIRAKQVQVSPLPNIIQL